MTAHSHGDEPSTPKQRTQRGQPAPRARTPRPAQAKAGDAVAPFLDTEEPLTKEDYERLAELRHALRRFARHTELEARNHGISPQQYLLMLAIKGFPGRDWANITELAERLQVRHNAVIGLVNRAGSRRLVMRVQDADRSDRRVVQVRLTPEGEQLLQHMAESLRNERARVRQAAEAVQGLSASGSDIPETSAAHAARD
jgi:DNA-binding MarR family transcriptional regulator